MEQPNEKKVLKVIVSANYGDLALSNGYLLEGNEISHENVRKFGNTAIFALAQGLGERGIVKPLGSVKFFV